MKVGGLRFINFSLFTVEPCEMDNIAQVGIENKNE